MNSFAPSLLLLSVTLGLASLPCSAQQDGNVALQFMTFPMTMEPLRVELMVGEGQTVELDVPSNELGPVVKVPPMSSFVLGETVLDKKEKPQFKVYGSGKSAQTPKQLVLLLRKGKTMAEGFEVRAISSDMNKFSGGKILFVNAASIDIGGKLGGVKFGLKPGAQSIMTPKLEANGRLTSAEFFYNEGGEAVPFFSSMWPVANAYRGLVFFYQDPNNANKIQLHSFRDFLDVAN